MKYGNYLVLPKQCIASRLTKSRGRVLYTNNYYTSMKLAMHMFETYGWTIVGTIVPTNKKSNENLDVPFLKLSNGARLAVDRGWMREAVIKLKTKTGKTYYIQNTIWRDKKQVCFLSSNRVGKSIGLDVKRHVKGKKMRDIIPAPQVQKDYATYFNAVDRNDRDSADYSTSIRTNRYYIRIFCWGLDRVIHTMYIIVCYLANWDIGMLEWKKYCDKHTGRHDFQIDLGIALLNYAISSEWDGESEKSQPMWMTKCNRLVPCDCDKCYFCVNGWTNGVCHKFAQKSTVVYSCGKRASITGCTEHRVNLDKGSDYCKMCYRKQPHDWSVA